MIPEVVEVITREVVIIQGRAAPESVVVETRRLEVVEVARQGPAGRPGAAGGADLSRVAGIVLSGHRLVLDGAAGGVCYATASNTDHAGRVLGLTLNAAVEGDPVEVRRSGEVEFSGWSWRPGLVFLAEAGFMSQEPPSAGFSQVVGFSVSPTRLFIDIREPYILGA